MSHTRGKAELSALLAVPSFELRRRVRTIGYCARSAKSAVDRYRSPYEGMITTMVFPAFSGRLATWFAAQIAAGEAPDNYLTPSALSDFERSHLRDAFVVVKTMQSAVGSGKGALG